MNRRSFNGRTGPTTRHQGTASMPHSSWDMGTEVSTAGSPKNPIPGTETISIEQKLQFLAWHAAHGSVAHRDLLLKHYEGHNVTFDAMRDNPTNRQSVRPNREVSGFEREMGRNGTGMTL